MAYPDDQWDTSGVDNPALSTTQNAPPAGTTPQPGDQWSVSGSAPTPAWTSPGQVLAAMNPGMAGFASVPSSAFNAEQPLTQNSGSGWPSSKDVTDALEKLGGSLDKQQQHNPPPPAPQTHQAQLAVQGGRGASSSGLSALVQMLQQRANQYGPPGYGSSSGGGRGLLGV